MLQPNEGIGSNGHVPDAQRHQSRHKEAVIYSLGGSPGSPHPTAAPLSAAGQQAMPAVCQLSRAGSGCDSPMGTPKSPGTGGPADPPKMKPGLSIAQQAVLRCRQKQMALGETQQDLQRRRQQLEDACPGNPDQQEASSPSQASGMSRGRMMHAHLAPPQPRTPVSACKADDRSGQELRELPPSQRLRSDSEMGQRPLPAGAKRGTQALGTSLHGSPAPDVLRAPKPDSSSSGVSSQPRQPGRYQEQGCAAKGSIHTHRSPSLDQEVPCQLLCSAAAGNLQLQQQSQQQSYIPP